MPRNSSGAYTLPAGNPVAPNTVIETAWANPTMSDIASALTDSLDRYGRGTMLAALKAIDGAQATPAITFNAEASSGLYRAGSHDVRLAIGGVDMVKFTDTGATFPAGIAGDLTTAGLIKLANGSLATPSLTFASDVTQGLFKVGVGVLGLAGRVVVNTTTDNGIETLQVGGSARVRSGAAGGGSASANYDELVLEGAGNIGLTMIAPATALAGMAFANPSSQFHGGLIYDHSAGVLQIWAAVASRLTLSANGASVATGQLFVPDGTAGAPSFAWTNSTAMGLYRAAANVLGIATAGAEKLRVLASADATVLVGETAALLGAAGRGLLEIAGSTTAFLGLSVAGANAAYLGASGSSAVLAAVGASSPLAFNTNGAEKARLTPAAQGELLLNTTSAAGLSVANRGLLLVDGSAGGLVDVAYAGTPKGHLISHSADVMLSSAAGTPLLFAFNGAEIARVDTDSTLKYGSNEVGFRDVPPASKTTAYTIVASDRGTCIRADAGCTGITAPTMGAGGPVVTVYNNTGGNLSLTAGSGLSFRWGTGTPITTSPRTLAQSAQITIYWISGTTAILTGAGIS